MIKSMIALIVFFVRPSAVLEKATVVSTQLQWLKNEDVFWIKVAYAEHYLRILAKLLIV